MKKVKCIVPISGGKDSQACMVLAVEEFGAYNVMGLFCDTKFEHPLTYEHVKNISEMYGGHREPKFAVSNTEYQKATSMGCMILQSIPINHINKLMNSGISNTQLKKMTGNAWTMKVISHILKCMEILK